MQHLELAIKYMEIYAGQRRFGSWRLLDLSRAFRSVLDNADNPEAADRQALLNLILRAEQEIMATRAAADESDAKALDAILDHLAKSGLGQR